MGKEIMTLSRSSEKAVNLIASNSESTMTVSGENL